MPTAIVLGAGMVGSVMAADLARDSDFQVTIADLRPEALQAAQARAVGQLQTLQLDLADPDLVRRTAADFDIVLGALASRLGFQTLRAVIEARRNYCDISFMPQDAWELDALARQNGVTTVVDCGVAPGMSNMIAGHCAAHMDSCDRIAMYVGGLPRVRRWPFEYKAGFSPHDVIEEYVRPARVVEHGRIVTKQALSEPELLDFPEVGTLEAFNTDGLRSLAHSLDVPFMSEKTLRYPGHAELMHILRETGLFSQEPIEVAGAVRVKPLDLTSALLFPKWMYGPGEEDLTVLRVVVEGQSAGRGVRRTWDMLDRYDARSQTTSMARTTAFPCTIVARLLASGELRRPGVIPPEILGRDLGLLPRVLDALQQRGVLFHERIEEGPTSS